MKIATKSDSSLSGIITAGIIKFADIKHLVDNGKFEATVRKSFILMSYIEFWELMGNFKEKIDFYEANWILIDKGKKIKQFFIKDYNFFNKKESEIMDFFESYTSDLMSPLLNIIDKKLEFEKHLLSFLKKEPVNETPYNEKFVILEVGIINDNLNN